MQHESKASLGYIVSSRIASTMEESRMHVVLGLFPAFDQRFLMGSLLCTCAL